MSPFPERISKTGTQADRCRLPFVASLSNGFNAPLSN